MIAVEMREVEVFLAIAEELHFGRAAARLRVTTSHVSQTLQRLERRVGGRLFERTSRRVVLTPLGEQVLDGFRPAFRQLQESLRRAQLSAQEAADTLWVAFSATVPPELASTLLDAFRRKHPHCTVVRSTSPLAFPFFWGDGGEHEPDLLIGWVPGRSPDMLPPGWRFGPVLLRRPRGLLMSESHPLASRTEVNVEELAEHQVLRIPLPPEFADSWTPPSTPAGRRVRRAYREVYHVEELPRLLRDDGLVHITIVELPRLIDLPGLVTIPLHGMPPLLCTVMVSPPPTSPQVLHFIDVTAGCRLPASWD